MVFCDLMNRLKTTELNTMNASTILHNMLRAVTPNSIHKARFNTLVAAVKSLLHCQQCTLTSIGRNLDSKTTEKHDIKRIDRLLSNNELLRESISVYVRLTRFVVTEKHPVILVDWSHADTQTKYCILRASIVSEGRSLTLYQESAFSFQYHCPKVQKRFLKMLKLILPSDCRPVIVTDAGFKVPWLKAVRNNGWHYISRVRGTAHLKTQDSDEFIPCQSLFKNNQRKSQYLGATELTKSAKYQTHAVLVGKGHKLLKRDKKRGYKEPWLLVSSLPKRYHFLEKVLKLYGMRMQIEAGFRDQKSVRFGLGSDLHRTNKLYRLDILLLLATLAHWFSMMLGAVIDKAGKTGAFQANSSKNRRVVSWAFVGLRYFKKQSIKLRRRDYLEGLAYFVQVVVQLDWKNMDVSDVIEI